jgi:two-component system, OmpR family, sensor histidine kinase MprB
MTLRRRLTLAGAAVVAFTVLIAAVVAYGAVRSELRSQVDQVLREQGKIVVRSAEHRQIVQDYGGHPSTSSPDEANALQGRGTMLEAPTRLLTIPGRVAAYVRILDEHGRATPFQRATLWIPVSDGARRVAAGGPAYHLADTTSRGDHLRVLTIPAPGIGAAQVARSLNGVDDVLGRLRLVLALLVIGGVAVAAVLARLAGRSLVRPVTDLTEAAEHVSATGDLGRRVPGGGADEVGRLAARFNAMLDRLQGSESARRRLIADASHELRTPVTSLRTNLEVLREEPDLAGGERDRLLDDVVHQTEELGALVADLIELARDGEPTPAHEDVRLDALVAEAVERAGRFSREVRFSTELEPVVVEGVPERLGRAVNNLLDNAARHSPPGAVVEVRLAGNALSVRDHGRGLDEADLPHLFDRFYRGADARERPGSGLGLAIVRQVAQQHGGSVRAENAAGGGARFVLILPVTPV